MSIAQVLEKVSAGGPTQSGIEVIAPSRPRPVVLRHRESARASRTREARTSQDDASTVTRVSATTPETDPTDDLIQTQIGALPRDLWQLIGERVPEQRVSNDQELEPAGDATTEPEPGATALTRGRHASPPVASLLQPPSGRPSTSGAPAIQRTTVAQQAQAPSASTAQDPATASPAQTESTEQQQSPTEVAFEGESGAEVDIGELARRVYAEIKRRLSVERERFRSF